MHEGSLIERNEDSDKRRDQTGGVQSGILQASVLALIMFEIYINDMPKGMKSCISLPTILQS